MNEMLTTALSYLNAGLCVVPAKLTEKRPALSEWAALEKRLPTEAEIKKWFSRNGVDIGVIGGAVSGNFEPLDFDCAGEVIKPFVEAVEEQAPGLVDKLLWEPSKHQGVHLCYRCESPVPGALKLAAKVIVVSGPGVHEYKGKSFEARQSNGSWIITPDLIETRGQGAFLVVSPSPGYVLKHGSFCDLPTITTAERAILIETARSFNEEFTPFQAPKQEPQRQGELLRGQDFDARGDVRALLQKHLWTFVKHDGAGRERWRRPGKDRSWSATLMDGKVLRVFSANAQPFEARHSYGSFGVYTFLEHKGDFKAATRALSAQGYGSGPAKPAPKGADIERSQETVLV